MLLVLLRLLWLRLDHQSFRASQDGLRVLVSSRRQWVNICLHGRFLSVTREQTLGLAFSVADLVSSFQVAKLSLS